MNSEKKNQTQVLEEQLAEDPAPPQEKKETGHFGNWLKFLYELTFIITITIMGTIVGTVLALLLPIGFPAVILWKRYVKKDGSESS